MSKTVAEAMLQGGTVQTEAHGGSDKSIETAKFVSTCFSPSSARDCSASDNINLKTDVSLTNHHLLSGPVVKEVEARKSLSSHVHKPYSLRESNSDAPGGLRTARPFTAHRQLLNGWWVTWHQDTSLESS